MCVFGRRKGLSEGGKEDEEMKGRKRKGGK